jgi:hypothetical protein
VEFDKFGGDDEQVLGGLVVGFDIGSESMEEEETSESLW